MFYPANLYLRDKWILLPLIGAFGFILFTVWYTATKISPSTEPIFLHYNIIFGIDLIGDWWRIWYIPLGGFVMFAVNFFLSYLFYAKNKFVSRFLSFSTALLEILVLTASVLIIGLNI